jgi:hypothetical protein
MLMGQLLYAQEAGVRDLSNSPTQSADVGIPAPNCAHGRVSNVDGLMVSKMRDKFVLSIEDFSSRLIPIGSEFVVTIRLKNISASPVTIPWTRSLQEVLSGQAPDNQEYQTASFTFRVETGIEAKRTTALEGEAVFYGAEEKPGSMLQLASGQWATVRVRAVAHCRWKSQNPSICPVLRPDVNARLTAEWSENQYTFANSNCDIQRGNFAGPRTESHPETIALTKQ